MSEIELQDAYRKYLSLSKLFYETDSTTLGSELSNLINRLVDFIKASSYVGISSKKTARCEP